MNLPPTQPKIKPQIVNGVVTIHMLAFMGEAWVARIRGLDSIYEIKREFERKHDDTGDAHNAHRHIEIDFFAEEDAIYEFYRQINNTRNERGFFKIKNNQVIPLTRAEVLAAARDLDQSITKTIKKSVKAKKDEVLQPELLLV